MIISGSKSVKKGQKILKKARRLSPCLSKKNCPVSLDTYQQLLYANVFPILAEFFVCQSNHFCYT